MIIEDKYKLINIDWYKWLEKIGDLIQSEISSINLKSKENFYIELEKFYKDIMVWIEPNLK